MVLSWSFVVLVLACELRDHIVFHPAQLQNSQWLSVTSIGCAKKINFNIFIPQSAGMYVDGFVNPPDARNMQLDFFGLQTTPAENRQFFFVLHSRNLEF